MAGRFAVFGYCLATGQTPSQRAVSDAGKYWSSTCPPDLGRCGGMLSVSKEAKSDCSRDIPKYQSSIGPPDLGRPEAAQDCLRSGRPERSSSAPKDSGTPKYQFSTYPPDLGNADPRESPPIAGSVNASAITHAEVAATNLIPVVMVSPPLIWLPQTAYPGALCAQSSLA
jgi:hypothetical protein